MRRRKDHEDTPAFSVFGSLSPLYSAVVSTAIVLMKMACVQYFQSTFKPTHVHAYPNRALQEGTCSETP
jgi:hypothetical protein